MKTSTLKRPLAKIGPCNFISIANLAYYNFLDRVVISLTIFTVYCDWPLKTLEVFQMPGEISRVEPVVVLRRPWGRWTLSWSLHYFPLLFVLFLPQKGNEIYVSFSSLRLLSNGIIHSKQGASCPIKLKSIKLDNNKGKNYPKLPKKRSSSWWSWYVRIRRKVHQQRPRWPWLPTKWLFLKRVWIHLNYYVRVWIHLNYILRT